MDDISFCDSSQCEHHGGVWGDAARLDKLMTPPAPEGIVKSSVRVGGSQPTDETGSSMLARVRTEPPALDNVPVVCFATTISEKMFTTARRRSWFVASADTEHTEAAEQEVVSNVKGQSMGSDNNPTPLPDTPTVVQPPEVSDNEQDPHEYLSPYSPPTPSYL